MPEDGIWIPLDRWPLLQAAYDVDSFGRLKTPCEPARVWVSGVEIEMPEFRYWVATRRHIQLNEPGAADADPRKAVDLSKMRGVGPRRQAEIKIEKDDF